MLSNITAAGAIIAAVIAGVVALATTLIAQKAQRRRDELDELAKHAAQFSTSLSSVLYSFLWITWCAKYEEELDGPSLKQYWAEIHQAMPRVYGGYVMVASLDKGIGLIARRLLDEAEQLDVAIGEAAPDTTDKSVKRLSQLYDRVEKFSTSVKNDLVNAMQDKRSKRL